MGGFFKKRKRMLIVPPPSFWNLPESSKPKDFQHKFKKDAYSMYLKRLDITIEDYFITPVIKCPVTGNFKPEDKIICRKYLWKEFEYFKPELALVLGFETWKYITDKEISYSSQFNLKRRTIIA